MENARFASKATNWKKGIASERFKTVLIRTKVESA
jgi:hypothetical protein